MSKILKSLEQVGQVRARHAYCAVNPASKRWTGDIVTKGVSRVSLAIAVLCAVIVGLSSAYAYRNSLQSASASHEIAEELARHTARLDAIARTLEDVVASHEQRSAQATTAAQDNAAQIAAATAGLDSIHERITTLQANHRLLLDKFISLNATVKTMNTAVLQPKGQ